MDSLIKKADKFIDTLCNQIGSRPVGSLGNRQATDFCTNALTAIGCQVETDEFPCLDWQEYGALCEGHGRKFTVYPSPYSMGCDIIAPLRVVSSLSELQSINCAGELLLVRGDLAREQLMPKNFPFYNPEEHQGIIALLEQASPAAIIAATGRNPELAGALYPFPLIEDGDFEIPSVFTTEENGNALVNLSGKELKLVSHSQRILSTACNVTGYINPGKDRKIMVCAHVDTKPGTAGALDNACGVVTLLLAAELLKASSGEYEIEFVVMNGEDYYGANGEKTYLAKNEGLLPNLRMVINLDALGLRLAKTAFSFYNLSSEDLSVFQRVVTRFPGIVAGEPWYQSDHAVFVMQGIRAVAVTSEKFVEIEQKYAHTPLDTSNLVDTRRLVEAALAVRDLILSIPGINIPD